MGLLGDFVKGFILYTVVLWVFAIIALLVQGYTALALLILFVLIIPISWITIEYLRNRKKNNMPTK